MKTAIFQYKCRRCGDIVDGHETGEDIAYRIMGIGIPSDGLPINIDDEYGQLATQIPHACNDGSYAADLIGYRVEEK